MKASDLKFDTPYNSGISLSVMAEMVRREEWVVQEPTITLSPEAGMICMVVIVPVKPVLELKPKNRIAAG